MNVRESKLTLNNDAKSPVLNVTNGKKNTKNSNKSNNISVASLINDNMNSLTSKSTTSKKFTGKKSETSNSFYGSSKLNSKNKNSSAQINSASSNSSSKNSTITNTNNSNSHLKKIKEETCNRVSKKSTTSKKLKKQKDKQLNKSNNQLNQIDQHSDQVLDSSNYFIEDSSLNLTMSSSTNNQQNVWYSKEIQNMMHGFGDSPTPNQESVRLVEEIVHQQIICLLRLACDIAIKRQSKQIGLEDFLFLLRKDKVKLCRLLKHFSLKDMRNRLPNDQWTTSNENQSTSNLNLEETVSALDAGCTIDFDEEELLNALILEQKTTQTATQTDTISDSSLLTQNLQSTTTTTSKATVFPQPTKRLKLCLDFLESIDQTGELDRYLQEDQFFDELKHNRMLRIEQITRFMSEKEYLNFYKARQASFANRQQPNKFRDWLFNVSFNQLDTNQWEIKPNALAIEILQYFAYETVAILVDLALIVKQDKRSFDPVSKLISPKTHTDSFPLLNSQNNNLSLYSDSNIDYTSLQNKQTNPTNLFNPSESFNNCLSMNNIYNQNIQINQRETQTTTILPSPFIFSSANIQTVECPFFSIKPQEIREVVRRYINCNPRGSLSSVLLFGMDQWNQQLIARSKIMCL